MGKLLTGYSDVIVRTTLLPDAKSTNIYAYVDINFPGDGNTISNIPWKKIPAPGFGKRDAMAFTSPRCVVINNGVKEGRAVFSGQFNDEVCALAAKAIDAIKRDLGGLKTGKTYRVNAKGATDITGDNNGQAVDTRAVVS